ncbi:uncharacterized protein UV8b_00523 [Ustilaginoidea virens]|uniref:Copper-fist domain-containing protein n=1 Tax=Ustilaginoidea virens TaxID=1159556 RepID=A0A8E5MEF2_USTVR|nr:uncharacterized protein UV8b_00523 [Ustilaginoidea virens]QUC16282.1 hypothetical protein UV8b_00523 [Ustilaginoidea virens]
MPLINGQKMACEPCIRGHRSTKCTHANERLMVPVRKPGRPLSSCPHPSSRPCACAAVTAAIPRKQKCRCGTSNTASPAHATDNDASSRATTPPSPSKHGHAGFRVHKQGTKSTSCRKQSVDIAGLQRMDTSQLNVMPPYNGLTAQQMRTTDGSTTPMSDASLYGTMAMAPSDGSVVTSQANFPLFPYTMPPSTIPAPGNPEPAADGETDGPANGSGTSSSRAAKSCCGSSGGGQKSSLQIDIPPGPTPPPSAKDKAEQKAESCCSPQPSYNAHIKESTAGIMSPPGIHFPPSPAMMHHPFEQGVAMGNGLYPFYAQPSIFNYPPQYGSYMQPLQPEQWRQFMAAMTFGQPGACPPFAMAGAVPMQQPPTTPNGSAWTSHHCSCGDSCQCIGCAAHPYNEATKNYVRSAWNTLREDSDKGPPAHANGNGSTLNGPAAIASGSNGSNGEHEEMANGASHGTSTPNTVNPDGTWSPVAAQTPSDAASGISEEQALSASDFFFVSYPFDDACAGQGSSCPCGDDCQCIGCTIHNISGPAAQGPGNDHP